MRPLLLVLFVVLGLGAMAAILVKQILPVDEEARRARAVQLLQQEQWDEAIFQFTEILQDHPEDIDAYMLRATAFTRKGDHQRAVADYTAAIRLEPSPLALRARARTYLRLQKYGEAIADFDRVLALSPDDATTLVNRGQVQLAQKQYDQASKDLDRALALKPNGEEAALAYLTRGRVHFERKNFAAAVADFSEAVRRQPGQAPALDHRGAAHHRLGQFEQADADYRESLRLDPKFPNSHNKLAWLLATCPEPKWRDGKKALEHATTACQLTNWKDSICLESLAAAHAELGQFDEAVKWQEKALGKAGFPEEERKEGERRLGLYKEKRAYRDQQ